MEGLNQHLEFQVKLAGKELAGKGSQSGASYDRSGPTGVVPDDIPDIMTMVPIERVAD